jgi:hypothetical protein
MGSLLQTRTEGTLPFKDVSMDCGGPFSLTSQRRRGLRSDTSGQFLAIVCHSTKAIHSEYLVSSHTVELVAALERFFSRRGVSNSITADNASSIVATAGLTGKTKEIGKKEGIDEDDFQGYQIDWRFVPARSPHRNGLAEAGIGAVKRIRRDKMGKQVLTKN